MTAHDLYQWYFEYFCGCGCPEDAMLRLRSILDVFREAADLQGRDKDYNLYVELRRLLPNDGDYWLTMNFLDHMGLTDHGSALPGWLSEQGKAVHAALHAYGVYLDKWGNHCSASSEKVCQCGQAVPGCDL